jgi:hypothetical protein
MVKRKMTPLRSIAEHDDGERFVVYVSLLGLGVREDAPFFLPAARPSKDAGTRVDAGFQRVRTISCGIRSGRARLFLD